MDPINLNQYETLKNNFQVIWELLLLHKDVRYDYDGSKATHDAFVEAEGMTPKHFARQWLEESGVDRMFVPKGRKQATVSEHLFLCYCLVSC